MPLNLPNLVSRATSSIPYPRAHDTTHSPVALWQFNDSLNDSSGNGRTLSVLTGTVKYGWILPGLKGVFLDSAALYYNSVDDVLNIVGDLTIEAIVAVGKCNSTENCVVSCAADGETLKDNFLYHLMLIPVDGTQDGRFFYPRYFAERSTGTNIIYDLPNDVIAAGDVFHFALVRSSDQVSFFVNGRQLGATSVGLLTPQKDSSGNLQKVHVGRSGPSGQLVVHMMLASLKIIASALTANQVKAEYERTIGNFYLG